LLMRFQYETIRKETIVSEITKKLAEFVASTRFEDLSATFGSAPTHPVIIEKRIVCFGTRDRAMVRGCRSHLS